MFLRLTGGESSTGPGGYRCLLLVMIRLCRSFMTISAMSLGRVLACQPSLSSAAENTEAMHHTGILYRHKQDIYTWRVDSDRQLPGMPLPLMVLAMMAVGWWHGWLRALQSSSTLCPSTTMACQLYMWSQTSKYKWGDGTLCSCCDAPTTTYNTTHSLTHIPTSHQLLLQ